MASNDSIFSSDKSEKNWILEIDKNFPQEEILNNDFETPTSVFRVPKTLSETKPEAYSPQRMGLGPYHHSRPVLYQMQKQKLSAVWKFLNEGKAQTFQQVVNALVQYEPVLRACYDQYIYLDIQTLARILAIDGLYLLHLLENEDPNINKVIGDVLMLDNQIPLILLEKIVQVLQFKTGGYENLFFTQFESICQAESPLKLNRQRMMTKINYSNQSHLMHQMYYLIMNNRGLEPISTNMSLPVSEITDNFDTGLGFLGQRGVLTSAHTHQMLSFTKKVWWNRISGLFKKVDSEKEIIGVEKIDIPSVSEMTEMAGIHFTLTNGGIRDIKFVEDSKKDVDILRKAEIIESELTDEEIVSIFNGIKKSTGMNNIPQSSVASAIDNVKKQYDNVFRVKAKRIVESYGSSLLKFLKTCFYVLVLVLATWQAYCLVFGCSRWFGKGSVVQGGDNLLLHSE